MTVNKRNFRDIVLEVVGSGGVFAPIGGSEIVLNDGGTKCGCGEGNIDPPINHNKNLGKENKLETVLKTIVKKK